MLHFIINPASSTGHGIEKWKIIEEQLKKDGIEYDAYFTEGVNDARNHTAELTSSDEHITLITLGGDGTVNETISGIRDLSKVTFGYIPTGSSNDLARAIGLPSDPLQALKIVLHPSEYRCIDIGKIECDGNTRSFAVSTGIGYDAAICYEALNSNIKEVLNKFGLGKLTYVIIALKQLAKATSKKCTITLDNSKKIELDKFLFVTVMNHKYEGGGFMFCPDAVDTDGTLDICTINNVPKLKVLRILPTAYKGNHVKFKEIHTYRAKEVVVTATEPCHVHSDGEICGISTEMKVSLRESRLKMIIR